MSSGFVSETEISELRKLRQEEWDRVRKAEDPIERPEELYDHRSLYDRLQEQKQKKDIEYEEAHKLKNMIKTLDDDEIEFLDLVDRSKLAADRKKELEEERELNDYRNRVATLQEHALAERLQIKDGGGGGLKRDTAATTPRATTTIGSQQKLLQGVVVAAAKRKCNETKDNVTKRIATSKLVVEDNNGNSSKILEEQQQRRSSDAGGGLKCIAILPGLGCYNDASSSDENSSGSDNEIDHNIAVGKMDLLGRKIVLAGKTIKEG